MIPCLSHQLSSFVLPSAPGVLSSLTLAHELTPALPTPATSSSIDPLLTSDLGYGIISAFILAGFATFLQSLRSQNDFVLAPPPVKDNIRSAVTNTTTFEDWKDISRPENFVLFTKRGKMNAKTPYQRVEQRWVFFALLLLFTPIFSFEFFLTVSRQLLCAWDQVFCQPYH
ncbi:hypothetical protein FisN_5Hu209 [Fistulifera solaris]|jgi:hypothetical protein|uniref:Uncharacterized protein n=1 Tax=Fistulifera solaris TaxID=1519565 RepID=A0A1Z5JSH4_FISSO|nr:hypothetical protein FisN_5Hu209 [Fistulifera solaris]|eukprot:GAX16836.1 hypothetical protein FisN_5Hu209 [Fistulifera solaris]